MPNPLQAQTVPTPPAPPAPPIGIQVPGGAGGITITTPGIATQAPAAVPSRAVLEARRSELSRQLNSASGRRDELVGQLREAPAGPVRTGLEARIGQLDARILDLEAQIAENGRLLTQTATGRSNTSIAIQSRGEPNVNFDATPVAIVATLFVFAPLAIASAWRMWRRATHTPVAAPMTPEMRDRLERIEQAVEAIAIEVERVSEGQRFVTRLMHESRGLGAGQQPMEPLRVPQAEAVRASR